MSDWIEVVEAGYDLSAPDKAWLERLLDTAAPLMDRGVGVNAQVFTVTPTRFQLQEVSVRGVGTPEMLRAFLNSAPPSIIDAVYRRGAPVGSLSEWLFPSVPLAQRGGVLDESERHFVQNTPANFQDSLGMMAHTGTGSGIALAAPLPTPARLNEPERLRWTRVAAHLGAGLRVRQRLGKLDIFSQDVEAVMRTDGRVEHAKAATKSPSARERLRSAVQRIERARTGAQRTDADCALDLWEGLVAGRWSLLDHFEADGRRHIVAVKNDPELSDPRGLSVRERQVAEFFGLGRPVKEIAYILGLTQSTIANTLARAAEKLSLKSKSELAALFSPSGMRARMREMELAGESLVVGVQAMATGAQLEMLSEAEREVALALLRGDTYTAIAAARGSAERTIANQAQSIYRKVGVSSRVQLASKLTGI